MNACQTKREFDDYLIKNMIRQSGMTREKFYGATKRTAQKAPVPFLKPAIEKDTE
jgi:hypothetical protein